MADIDKLLLRMRQANASDLHLRVGMRPRFRINGNIEEDQRLPVLDRETIQRLIGEILTREQALLYSELRELDISYGTPELGRFRCNCFHDHRGPAAVFRRIPSRVPTLRDLDLPEELAEFAHLRRGLVLVTGSSGSGKTSTLAAILDVINDTYRKHIITLEDPIEYLHQGKRAIIHQRGMHYDIRDFQSGIIDATRQDPDVLLIGELRDLESIRQALVAAEIGVLVFATLHTNSAAESIDRIVDVFPPNEQPQVRTILSQSLNGVIAQVLLDRADRPGRVPAVEILRVSHGVANMIRESKTQDIPNAIQSGRSQGMRSLDDSLRALLERGAIDAREAFLHARNKSGFDKMVERDERRERAAARR